MRIGLAGLGRMGGGIRERLRRAGHEVVGYDLDADLRDADSLEAMVEALDPPRSVWLMLPSGEATEGAFADLLGLLSAGDLVIEGGNSRYTDSIRRAGQAEARGLRFLDCGVSGGVWGLEAGYCLMVGGPRRRSPAPSRCSPRSLPRAATRTSVPAGPDTT